MNFKNDLGVGYFLVTILHFSLYLAFRNQIELELLEAVPLFISSVISIFSFILEYRIPLNKDFLIEQGFKFYLLYLVLYLLKLIYLYSQL